jgi:hypothetical protein
LPSPTDLAGLAVDSDAILTYTSKVDALVDRIDALLDHQQGGQNAITVTHTQAGVSSWWNVASVCACFFTIVMLIVINNNLTSQIAELRNGEVRDLRAWSDQYRQQIATLRQQIQEKKP